MQDAVQEDDQSLVHPTGKPDARQSSLSPHGAVVTTAPARESKA